MSNNNNKKLQPPQIVVYMDLTPWKYLFHIVKGQNKVQNKKEKTIRKYH